MPKHSTICIDFLTSPTIYMLVISKSLAPEAQILKLSLSLLFPTAKGIYPSEVFAGTLNLLSPKSISLLPPKLVQSLFLFYISGYTTYLYTKGVLLDSFLYTIVLLPP